MDIGFFRDKKVVIMGLGRFGGGIDSAIFAAKSGANVMVTDLQSHNKLSKSVKELKAYYNIEYRLGEHLEEDFASADIVIVNPAVPRENKYIKIAKDKGALITSQVELFFEICPAKIIGITGANGKSTTTSLTAHLLEAGIKQENLLYSKVWLGGNIGNKPLLSILEEIKQEDLVVLELSSFQTEPFSEKHIAPYVSVITNLTPNHLDRHKTFEAYCQAKENMFSNQKLDDNNKCISIYNADDEVTSGMYEKYKDETGRKSILFKKDELPIDVLGAYNMPGPAYRENLAAAYTVANFFGVNDDSIVKALPKFQSLPHRLELVADRDNIRWFNDSISTTPASTIVAINAFKSPKILIAGGYDKNLPFDKMGEVISERVKAVILIGQTAEKIKASIPITPKSRLQVEMAFSLQDAVNIARRMAIPGDVVLLSPACASYDMFENFEQRGLMFKELAGSSE